MDFYWTVLYLISLFTIVKGSLLCSQCNSHETPDCEKNPPTAELCWQSGRGVQQSCNIIKEYILNTKILIAFRRDCSTMVESTCYNPQGQNNTLCIDVCFTDNCNSLASTSTSALPLGSVISLLCFIARTIL